MGSPTIRATVEIALRRVVDQVEYAHTEQAAKQRQFLAHVSERIDVDALASAEMWR